jgi:hypothetical protein
MGLIADMSPETFDAMRAEGRIAHNAAYVAFGAVDSQAQWEARWQACQDATYAVYQKYCAACNN